MKKKCLEVYNFASPEDVNAFFFHAILFALRSHKTAKSLTEAPLVSYIFP